MKRDDVSGLKFVVLGAARSGVAAARLLRRHGADVIVADSKPAEEAGAVRLELDALGIVSAWGDDLAAKAVEGRDVMVKSPGIPQTNPLVLAARQQGTRVISEIELASAFVPQGVRTIAITGTNGKTTTTAMTAHVLNACGYRAILAGNIGDAWCNRVEDVGEPDAANSVFVVEVSSFQLEDLEDFSPQVAMLTNISPDHMDRYDDRMDLYVGAKANILRNFCGDSIFIWNATDAGSQPIAERCNGRIWSFSADTFNDGLAAGVEDGQVMLGSAAVLPVKELPLPGRHNVENALCAVLAAAAMGATSGDIAKGLRSFPGVEHRIELCGVREDGVKFYNDSKATNLDAMEKAVLAFEGQPIVLIAGGRDAHSDYASVGGLIKERVAQLVTLGEAAELIEAAWGDLVPTRRAGSMAEAVRMADEVAVPGNVVVLSPACKSFDMYKNFEERGRDFKREVDRWMTSAKDAGGDVSNKKL